jgi:hypothetical protein
MTRLYSTDTGAPQEIPEADVTAALQSGKYGLPAGTQVPVHSESGIDLVPVEQLTPDSQIASDDEHQAYKLQRQYGTLGQQALTGVEGLASGASLGLSDIAEGALLGNTEQIEARRKANPWTAGIAQVAGAVAPSLVTGGVAEGAEGASLLGRAGGLASDVVGAPTRGLARVGGAVEDAVAGFLGASDADSFASALAKQVASKGAAAAVEGAGIGAAQHLHEESLGDPDANGESLLAAMGHGALLGFGTGAVLGAGGQIGKAVLGRLSPHMSALAEGQAAQAVAGRATRALDELPGGARAAGRRLLDDGVIEAGETADQIAPKVVRAAKAADARMGEVLEVADRAGHEGPDVESLFRSARKSPEATAALETLTGVPSVEQAAAKGLDRDAMIWGSKLTFRDSLNAANAPALKGIIDAPIAEAADRAARKMGGTFLDDYREAKLAVDQYAVIQQAVAKRLAMGEPPLLGGLGSAALGVGLVTHPVAAASGLALALAKKAAAERGSSTAAVILDKLSALRGVERARQQVETNIERGLSGVIPGAERAPVRVKIVQHAGGADSYAERVEAVQRGMADAEKAATAGIEDHAPKTARAFQSAANRGIQYLSGLIPKRKDPPSITPQFDKPHVANAQEKSTFNRSFDAVHDPMSVLRAAQDGRLRSDQVKALATVYPALYAHIVQQAQARLADLKKPLTATQKSQLGILLGRPVDPELTRRFQATYAEEQPKPANPQQPQHANKAPKRPITAPAKNLALDVGRPPGS